MRRSKKMLALCLVVTMAAGIYGCDSDSDSETTKVVEEATPKQVTTQDSGTTNTVSQMEYSLKIDADTSNLDETSVISDSLYGLFIEDINHTVDGGMYAEMVKNGSFEYGDKANKQAKHGWEEPEADFTFEVQDGSTDQSYLNENNTHYAVLTNTADTKQGIGNTGYLNGLSITKDAQYKVTVFLKSDSYTGDVTIVLEDTQGNSYGEATIDSITNSWWKYEVTLTATDTKNSGLRLCVKIGKGTVAMDSLSMFPTETYKNRENGIRKDIGEYLESLNPSFLRFPGGCLIEGKTLEDAYSWKQSIGYGLEWEVNGETTVGDVAARSYDLNIWNNSTNDPYYMTYGMGFYEFFLLCEDLDCMPVPVVNAGMTCPIQSDEYYSLDLNSDEFQQYIQDALDLIEFCRGDETTTWGAVRIAMGHPEKFPLTYVGIGNEQWQTEYYMHYNKFVEALEAAKAENPEVYEGVSFIVANGPNSGDQNAWNVIKTKSDKLSYAGLVDEHYYETPDWFLENTTRYDSYDRSSVPVFLGEYAAKSNDMEAALAEAAYLTGIERNADIVKMACYAPLFANDKSNQWEPDMIWYSNDSVYGSVNYYVQKMFANNVGINILKDEFVNEIENSQNDLYETTSIDENGDIIIKLVNVGAATAKVDVEITGATDIQSEAKVTTLSASNKTVKNTKMTLAAQDEESTITVGEQFTYEMKAYSVNIIRISQGK
jgi:alpha-L-arabinofuranosidase